LVVRMDLVLGHNWALTHTLLARKVHLGHNRPQTLTLVLKVLVQSVRILKAHLALNNQAQTLILLALRVHLARVLVVRMDRVLKVHLGHNWARTHTLLARKVHLGHNRPQTLTLVPKVLLVQSVRMELVRKAHLALSQAQTLMDLDLKLHLVHN